MDFGSLWLTSLEFLHQGGDVLFVIAVFACVLFILSLERILYFSFSARKTQTKLLNQAVNNASKNIQPSMARYAESRFLQALNPTQPYIKFLSQSVTLLGLLGTVFGMIEIFDVIALQGTGDARALAEGISKATLPTMTGMAVAIIGLFLLLIINSMARKQAFAFREELKRINS